MSIAMNKMLSEIHFQIPNEILNLAYSVPNPYTNMVTSPDDAIMTQVIRGRLMVDLNLASQEMLYIPLNKCKRLYSDTLKASYYIPKELTDGRSIISVHSLLSSNQYYGSTNIVNHGVTSNSLMNQANHIMNSLDDANIRQTAHMELIGENTILIHEGMLHEINIMLTVIVENDANLTNINPKTILKLSHMAVLVTKAHIYNTLIVRLNKGAIYAGHELSVIKDIIEDYKDAENEYREYYNTVWKKVAFMNNEKSMHQYIGAMMGNTV